MGFDAVTKDEVLLRRCEELTREFGERHAAKAKASKFVDALLEAPLGNNSARDRERERAAAELYVRYGVLSDLFDGAPIELEEFSFTLLLAIMRAAIEYGKLTAPDGRAARSARHDRAGVKFVTLVQAVMIYLEEHPELEPKASAKFANIIRPDILDAMELPRMRSRPL